MPGLAQPIRFVILDPLNNTIIGAYVENPNGDSARPMLFKQSIHARQWDAWQNGALIQNAMPELTADEREFLLTGMTPEEWDATFGEEE